MINHHFLAPGPLKPLKSSPGHQISLGSSLEVIRTGGDLLHPRLTSKSDGLATVKINKYEKK